MKSETNIGHRQPNGRSANDWRPISYAGMLGLWLLVWEDVAAARTCGGAQRIQFAAFRAALGGYSIGFDSSLVAITRAISTFCESGDSQRAANKILWPPRLRRLRWGIRTICEFE